MKNLRRMLSAVICIAMLICLFPLSASVSAADKAGIPVIYMRGRGTELYDYVGTDNQKQIYPLEYSDEYITEKVKEVIPILAKAVLTQNYDEYCDYLYNCVAPLFSEIELDENGDARNDSGIAWSWPASPLENKADASGEYDIYDYVFRYDWRLDPCEVADSLNDYIKAVKAATG